MFLGQEVPRAMVGKWEQGFGGPGLSSATCEVPVRPRCPASLGASPLAFREAGLRHVPGPVLHMSLMVSAVTWLRYGGLTTTPRDRDKRVRTEQSARPQGRSTQQGQPGAWGEPPKHLDAHRLACLWGVRKGCPLRCHWAAYHMVTLAHCRDVVCGSPRSRDHLR